MSIPDPVRANFDVLLRAAENCDLALMECTDAETGVPRYVLCAVAKDGDAYVMTPFGHMVSDQDPYTAYIPPNV
ncbi:DUF6117 family protein [Asticcacaulis sp. EMRT-3]|uniref:DUF6117 family protein n=1 Tax=Asticcacaulis sp. EMRT-3 TaxID=3040349 RepID=UPI0024AEB115|nr:DUF6117 family protein [Asticcacaulis sp. EMRT-3]MDI7776590.1 DUF6117 family protein [Asticcacaulis sp. EMRT-3]